MPAIAGYDEVRGVYERLLTAWNERSAERYGALFAADGLLVGFDGSRIAAANVSDHLGPIFADHPTAAYVAKVVEGRQLGSGAVLLMAIAGMTPPGHRELSPDRNAVQTILAERSDERWSVKLFQNTPAQYHGRPDLAEQHTRELQELVSNGAVLG
jgi:uncharacterized protein (TIGR02246 family)